MIFSLSHRLINWGRVTRQIPRLGHCLSIEYRFRAPAPDLTPTLAAWLYERGLCSEDEVDNAYQRRHKARGEAPDIEDAWIVESAWRSIPTRSCKALLAMFYVKRRQPAYIARRLKVDFDRELMVSQGAIASELEKLVVTNPQTRMVASQGLIYSV